MRERLQRVGRRDVHERDRHRGVIAEVDAVRAGGDERVDALVRLREGTRRLERVLEAPVEHAHLGAPGEHRCRALDDLAQAARAERPDDRLLFAAEGHVCLLRTRRVRRPSPRSAESRIRDRCPENGTPPPVSAPAASLPRARIEDIPLGWKMATGLRSIGAAIALTPGR
jgi:hypothetical protein